MTRTDAALHPGEYFIELRDKPTSSWQVWTRDDSFSTMTIRMNYQKDILRPGQGVRFFSPAAVLIEEFIAVDKAPAVGEATA